jgi:hypothetical protein
LLANNPDAQMKADAADLIKAAERDEADVPPVSVSEPTMTPLAAAALLLLCWPAWFHRTRRTSPH